MPVIAPFCMEGIGLHMVQQEIKEQDRCLYFGLTEPATKLEFSVAKKNVVVALAAVSVAISSPENLSRVKTITHHW